jgi:hypothetical protein
MMIGFLYKILKDSQSPNFVCNQNTVEKKVCRQQYTNIFQLKTSVFYQWCGCFCGKLVLQESMNIQ